MLNYVITNSSKRIFIRLNETGHPVTCSENNKQSFEYSKARNIVDNLPKSLKRFHFKTEPVPEIANHSEKNKEVHLEKKKEIIRVENYSVPSEVNAWVEKVKTCNNLAREALERKNELLAALSNVDRGISNITHKVELEKKQNACEGYKRYRDWKQLVDKRRVIKDELTIVSTILDSNLSSIATNRIQKAVEGLGNRCFEMRDFVEIDNT